MFLSPRALCREIDEVPGVRSRLSGELYLASAQKRLVDLYSARVLRHATEPVVRLARLAVWAEDGQSALIGLPRVGMGGAQFSQYKIRTMTPGSEHTPQTVRAKSREDDRITRVGQKLRALSIDELPQLRNVTEGTMSLVGPRPKSLAVFNAYAELDGDFEQAYTAGRPGLTGLEQISGRALAPIDERIELTKQYAAEASLALDAEILTKTVCAVLSQDGAF